MHGSKGGKEGIYVNQCFKAGLNLIIEKKLLKS